MARKCKPKSAAQGTNDAALLQRSEKYKKPIPMETGKNLKYDVKELRGTRKTNTNLPKI